jgi:hypothetical protein
MIPHQGIFFKFPSHPTSIRLIWSLGRDKILAYLSCILLAFLSDITEYGVLSLSPATALEMLVGVS